jgi:ligand-binding sensor domain-containing protein
MFCSGGGLISIQGNDWTEFNQSNSELPDMWIRDIETFGDAVWIASYGRGLARYDGSGWTVYDTANSDIPTNYLKDLAIGSDGLLWVATQDGLVTFDGVNWEHLNAMEANVVEAAPNGNIWVGYDGDGLARLNEGNWATFNTHNSELLEDFILSIEADDLGEVWVGTMTQGISVLEVEGTAVASGIDEATTMRVSMFPLPASESLTINTEDLNSVMTFQVSDMTGRVLMSYELSSKISTIDISQLAVGHYAYTLIANDGRSAAGIIPVN